MNKIGSRQKSKLVETIPSVFFGHDSERNELKKTRQTTLITSFQVTTGGQVRCPR
jgi:hypothetical protein